MTENGRSPEQSKFRSGLPRNPSRTISRQGKLLIAPAGAPEKLRRANCVRNRAGNSEFQEDFGFQAIVVQNSVSIPRSDRLLRAFRENSLAVVRDIKTLGLFPLLSAAYFLSTVESRVSVVIPGSVVNSILLMLVGSSSSRIVLRGH